MGKFTGQLIKKSNGQFTLGQTITFDYSPEKFKKTEVGGQKVKVEEAKLSVAYEDDNNFTSVQGPQFWLVYQNDKAFIYYYGACSSCNALVRLAYSPEYNQLTHNFIDNEGKLDNLLMGKDKFFVNNILTELEAFKEYIKDEKYAKALSKYKEKLAEEEKPDNKINAYTIQIVLQQCQEIKTLLPEAPKPDTLLKVTEKTAIKYMEEAFQNISVQPQFKRLPKTMIADHLEEIKFIAENSTSIEEFQTAIIAILTNDVSSVSLNLATSVTILRSRLLPESINTIFDHTFRIHFEEIEDFWVSWFKQILIDTQADIKSIKVRVFPKEISKLFVGSLGKESFDGLSPQEDLIFRTLILSNLDPALVYKLPAEEIYILHNELSKPASAAKIYLYAALYDPDNPATYAVEIEKKLERFFEKITDFYKKYEKTIAEINDQTKNADPIDVLEKYFYSVPSKKDLLFLLEYITSISQKIKIIKECISSYNEILEKMLDFEEESARFELVMTCLEELAHKEIIKAFLSFKVSSLIGFNQDNSNKIKEFVEGKFNNIIKIYQENVKTGVKAVTAYIRHFPEINAFFEFVISVLDKVKNLKQLDGIIAAINREFPRSAETGGIDDLFNNRDENNSNVINYPAKLTAEFIIAKNDKVRSLDDLKSIILYGNKENVYVYVMSNINLIDSFSVVRKIKEKLLPEHWKYFLAAYKAEIKEYGIKELEEFYSIIPYLPAEEQLNFIFEILNKHYPDTRWVHNHTVGLLQLLQNDDKRLQLIHFLYQKYDGKLIGNGFKLGNLIKTLSTENARIELACQYKSVISDINSENESLGFNKKLMRLGKEYFSKGEYVYVLCTIFYGNNPEKIDGFNRDEHKTLIDYFLNHPNPKLVEIAQHADPFLFACEKGDLEVVKAFLQDPAFDPNKTHERKKAFHQACKSRNKEVIELLLQDQRIDVNAVDNNGNTVFLNFIITFISHDIEILRVLSNHPRINIDQENNVGETPLLQLCLKYPTAEIASIIAILLGNQNLDIKKKNEQGETPLYRAVKFACEYNECEILDVLLNYPYIEVNPADEILSLFSMACENGKIAVVQRLLENPTIDVNKTIDNYTPLMRACMKGHLGIVEILLNDKRVDISKTNENTASALTLARVSGHNNIVQILEKAMAAHKEKALGSVNSMDFSDQKLLLVIVQLRNLYNVFFNDKKYKRDKDNKFIQKEFISTDNQIDIMKMIGFFLEMKKILGKSHQQEAFIALEGALKNLSEIIKVSQHNTDAFKKIFIACDNKLTQIYTNNYAKNEQSEIIGNKINDLAPRPSPPAVDYSY